MGVFATSNMARITFLFCALAIIVSTAAIDTKVSRTDDAIVPEVTALEEESGAINPALAEEQACYQTNSKAGDLATQVCDKVTEKSSTLGSLCTSALDALWDKLDAKCYCAAGLGHICTETVGEDLVQEQSGASIDICSTINSKAEELATSACDAVTEKSSTLGSLCTSALDALMEKLDAKCTETVGEELVQEESRASIDICSTINTKAGDLATQVCDKVTEKSSTLGSVCTSALDALMEKLDAKCTETVGEELVQEQSG